MARSDYIKQLIFASGQAQADRLPPGLRPGFVDIDENDNADLLRFMKRMAPLIHFYAIDDASTPAGDWSNFFPFDEAGIEQWFEKRSGDCPPHLGLIGSFLDLYEKPRELINQLTRKHVDFFYSDVLRLEPAGPSADRCHLLLQLKKNAGSVLITPEHRFSGGWDDSGVERIYVPMQNTVINRAKVASLRSIYVDATGKGTVRFAPIANSKDGLGAELDESEPKWPAFGVGTLPAAETGFALASPVLRMKEGLRKIALTLNLNPADSSGLNTSNLKDSFELFITGEKRWLGPFSVTPEYSDSRLIIELTIGKDQEAIADYDVAIHGYTYDARSPLIQLLLNTRNNATGYRVFDGIGLESARIDVEVSEVTDLQIESDSGKLNAHKAFLPFGSQPKPGNRLSIGCAEALNKKLSEISLDIHWQDAPVSMNSHYGQYSVTVTNSSFTAAVAFNDASNWKVLESGQALFDGQDASVPRTLTFKTGESATVASWSTAQFAYTLNFVNSQWAQTSLNSLLLANPVYTSNTVQPTPAKEGFIMLTLERDFLHETYRKDYVSAVVNFSKSADTTVTLPNEPYTPVIQSLSLAYKAHSDTVSISSGTQADFANLDLQFYHLGYFGQMREHGYPRNLFAFLSDKKVTLLPRYPHRGELIIGVEGIEAGDDLSLLLRVAEGSADPDLPREAVRWFVLCDNYWNALGNENLWQDGSDQFLTSGIVRMIIPREATTINTILPEGPIWLKAAVSGDVNAVPKMIDVAANAIEVEFIDRGNDPRHLAEPLSAGKITKLKSPEAGIKSVSQPDASFGGHLAEQDDVFHTRTAERLRHKDRALTGWDYERIVLQHFPSLHKIKLINHAKPGNWLAPGHVMAVVIPKLHNKNAINPLQPRVDSITLAKIQALLEKRTGMQVEVHVRNPRYRQVQLFFKVKFRSGASFNFYQQQLQNSLQRMLSPWAYSESADIEFGGTLYKSALIDFIDELDYVDFLTEVKLYSFINADDNRADSMRVEPQSPDEILVSADSHSIFEYT